MAGSGGGGGGGGLSIFRFHRKENEIDDFKLNAVIYFTIRNRADGALIGNC